MLLSVTMIGCNYAPAQAVMLFLMSLSFFGKDSALWAGR